MEKHELVRLALEQGHRGFRALENREVGLGAEVLYRESRHQIQAIFNSRRIRNRIGCKRRARETGGRR